MQLEDFEAIPSPGQWSQDAACALLGAGADIFTAARKPLSEDLDVAVRVCRHCRVRAECAGYAADWAMYGLWAGRWYGDGNGNAQRPQTVA